MRSRSRCAAGFVPERQDETAGLADIVPDIGEGLADWIVTAPGGEQMLLQFAYFDRLRDPVVMDIGLVLDEEDVVGGKVRADVPSRGATPTWPRRCSPSLRIRLLSKELRHVDRALIQIRLPRPRTPAAAPEP
jgi:hypothetical protein